MHFREICSKQCVLVTFGVILSTVGIIFAIFWTQIFDSLMAKELAIRPGSKSFDIWKTPPLPMSIDIYFYNWTNPQDITNFSTRPILVELGPYKFVEKSDKTDIRWHPENISISFKKQSYFYFDQEGSNGSLDTMITTLNVVALSAAAKARQWDVIRQKSVSVGLSLYEQQITVTKTARELLFEGYQDDLIDMAREYPIFGDDVAVPFDRFGWFYTRNGTDELQGRFNMFTGADDIRKMGQMHSWNYMTSTNFFSSYCGMVNGSAGEFYPPKQSVDSTITFFTPDLCRSITFDYNETVTVEGIEGFKYSGGPRTVDNGTIFPENSCFCNGECVPSGVLNVSSCRFGTPVFMSFPHYFNADPYYLRQVDGLSPSREKHEFYMILEPTTGIALEVAARFQINMLLRPERHVNLYHNVPYVFLPVLWFEQKVKISPEMAADVRLALSIPVTGQICAGIILAIGLIMTFWTTIDACVRRKGGCSETNKLDTTKTNVITLEKNLDKPEGYPLIESKTQPIIIKSEIIQPTSGKIPNGGQSEYHNVDEKIG